MSRLLNNFYKKYTETSLKWDVFTCHVVEDTLGKTSLRDYERLFDMNNKIGIFLNYEFMNNYTKKEIYNITSVREIMLQLFEEFTSTERVGLTPLNLNKGLLWDN